MNFKITLAVLVFIFPLILSAQQLQHSEDTGYTDKPAEVLNQFALGSGTDGGFTPKATVKTYKLSAAIGQGYWDFYLFNSLPAIPPVEGDSVTTQENRRAYVRNDLVRQLGGLMNISLSKVGFFGYGGDEEVREIKGAQIDFRMGAKAVDAFNRRKGESFLIPIFQSTLDLRYLIPLVMYTKSSKKGDNKVNLKDRMVGNLSFRACGAFMQVLSSDVYDHTFISKKGVPASPTIWTGTFETFFYISDQIYINVGFAMTNQSQIPNTPFFSIAYGRQ